MDVSTNFTVVIISQIYMDQIILYIINLYSFVNYISKLEEKKPAWYNWEEPT